MKEQKEHCSEVPFEEWPDEVDFARLIAIPQRWWSIKDWKFVNGAIRRGAWIFRKE